MRILWTKARTFTAEPVAPAWRRARPGAQPVAVTDAVVLAVAFEARDRARPEVVAAAARWAAAALAPGTRTVVLHSFHFLAPEPLPAEAAEPLYAALEAALAAALGAYVVKTAFGWRHALHLLEDPAGQKGVVAF